MAKFAANTGVMSLLDWTGVRNIKKTLSSFITRDAILSPATVSAAFRQSDQSTFKCSLCGSILFKSLEEFRDHRRSSGHLAALSQNQTNEELLHIEPEKPSTEAISPQIQIVFGENCYIQLFKILLFNNMDERYRKNALDATDEVVFNLKELFSSKVLIVLNGGGYFAAAIFDLSAEQMVCSKTLRKYTCRRKQGGSQSIKDSSKSGAIHSAGAVIRRENEKRLQEQIHELFNVRWLDEMNSCTLALCNRDPILKEELVSFGRPIRTVPITTYQACFEEVVRCFNLLFNSVLNK